MTDRDPLAEQTISGELAFEGGFLRVQRDLVRLPDGASSQREYILHPGAVMIVPRFDDGRLLLERQYRHPLGRSFIEFPAGKIDPGESALTTGQRELEEETGYRAERWTFLAQIHNAIAYSNEHIDLYLAEGLTAGTQRLDVGEFLEIFTMTLPELITEIRSGKVTDVKTVVGALWLENFVSKA